MEKKIIDPMNDGKHSLHNSKDEELPEKDDVINFKNNVDKNLIITLEKFKKALCEKDEERLAMLYKELSIILLVQLIIFNKRRVGEVPKITKKQYRKRFAIWVFPCQSYSLQK